MLQMVNFSSALGQAVAAQQMGSETGVNGQNGYGIADRILFEYVWGTLHDAVFLGDSCQVAIPVGYGPALASRGCHQAVMPGSVLGKRFFGKVDRASVDSQLAAIGITIYYRAIYGYRDITDPAAPDLDLHHIVEDKIAGTYGIDAREIRSFRAGGGIADTYFKVITG